MEIDELTLQEDIPSCCFIPSWRCAQTVLFRSKLHVKWGVQQSPRWSCCLVCNCFTLSLLQDLREARVRKAPPEAFMR
jgi:hypothetical protein